MSTPGRVAALQRWIALEHEAIWVYATLGGRVASLSVAARTQYDRHRAARDRLAALLSSLGADVPGPHVAYGDVPEKSARAVDIENRIAEATVLLVGVSPTDRERALTALRAGALVALDWGADPDPFPGLG